MPLYFGTVYAPDAHQSGTFIISEANFFGSRGRVMIRAGAGQLAFGMVLGRSNSDGKWVPSPATASDGSDQAQAILYEDVDASSVDVSAGVIARRAEVFSGALTFDPSITDYDGQQAKWAQLAAVEIIVRGQDDPGLRATTNARQTLGY